MDASRDDAFFLDLDGTLIDTTPTPDGARVSARVRAVLQRLGRATRGATMIVSGRAIATLDAMLRVRMPAAGQHGAEMRFLNPALDNVRVGLADFPALLAACEAIRARHPGTLLEVKDPAVALHLPAGTPAFLRLFGEMRALAAAQGGRVACMAAHNVVELRPANVHKGRAVEGASLLRPFAGRRPIFIGNDTPDIEGFRAATARGGYGVAVGAPLEGARYRLDGPGDVLDALEAVAGAA
jgi:trehalose 6-phosphate phosphatase